LICFDVTFVLKSISVFLFHHSGIEEEQKKLVFDLLDGKFEEVLKNSQEFLQQQASSGNMNMDSMMETARQNLLSDPSLAAASGIPMEALNDPVLFQDFMQNSLGAFFGADAAGAAENLFGNTGKQKQKETKSTGGGQPQQKEKSNKKREVVRRVKRNA
jgi:hypothetical protein